MAKCSHTGKQERHLRNSAPPASNHADSQSAFRRFKNHGQSKPLQAMGRETLVKVWEPSKNVSVSGPCEPWGGSDATRGPRCGLHVYYILNLQRLVGLDGVEQAD